MDQEKIGKFILEMRKEKNMTQQELATILGVTDRAISHWENGRRLPDYSLIRSLCAALDISVNELFACKRLKDEDYKKNADDNLMEILENSSFTLQERIIYFKDKWKKEHFFSNILLILIWIVVLIVLNLYKVDLSIIYIVGSISLLLIYVIEFNRLMAYIEKNAYRKIKK